MTGGRGLCRTLELDTSATRIKHCRARENQTMSGIAYPNTQAMFYEQYESVRRDEVIGILLALFLGGFGAHHFYLRRTGLGILYACFCWTPFPWVLGFIECFFMPGRVREFNAIQAAGIAAALGMSVPLGWGWPTNVPVNAAPQPVYAPAAATLPLAGTLIACSKCQQTNVAGSRFCSACGAVL
jgi:TM2 domain-containing membrane protein YozV